MFRTITVYSPESPGLTVCELGLTLRLILAAADTGVAIIGNIETSIKLTRKNAARLERDTVYWVGGDNLIKRDFMLVQ